MLAGDFGAIASPACNGGRQITLSGGFENNRIDPAQFSRAALNLMKHLPSTTDPCGQVSSSHACLTPRPASQPALAALRQFTSFAVDCIPPEP